ncbi:DNA-binding response regulator [Streptomyces sp. NRRL B-1677]|uniref:DNA-binding response regulator n=1 Tax=Streptomyces klenkii TaxID=1420899 RepID=A0A3B0BRQ8_9ACTN|nr:MULTISPECIES: DNA-binding response regulator [Streptomyces]MBF6049066.1 DNA-binding response regulator [Streptomyces sp. NRRL B-1677]RKN74356.1 DNA-binding response regulator [Streptomyces klenkii]
MFKKPITISVHATDELARARFAREVRAVLPEVKVVRRDEEGDVDFVLMGADDHAAAATVRRLTRAGEAPVVLVADELGESELMAVSEYGVESVLWRPAITRRRLSQAVHSAAGCCPKAPMLTALV